MQPYDIATVVFDEEIELLALQAKSIDLFGQQLSIGRIHLIANGPKQKQLIDRITSEVFPFYGRRKSQVQIIAGQDITPRSVTASGWYAQQVIKIAVAKQVNATHYVTLDAKNHLVRLVDDRVFFCREGIPWFYPASQRGPMSDYFMNSARICGVDGDAHIDSTFPTITPAVLYRDQALNLLDFIARSKFRSLDALICESGISVTEYMLYYCLLIRMNKFNELYRVGPRLVITLWHSHVQDPRQFMTLMGETEMNAAPFFSVHRLARAILTEQQRQRIISFWRSIGLVHDMREAARYLTPKGERRAMRIAKRRIKSLRVRSVSVWGRSRSEALEPSPAVHVDPYGFVRKRRADGGEVMAFKVVDSDAADGFKLRERAAALGKVLRPMKAVGYDKRRFGSKHDGGYVMLNDFDGIGAAFSLGIAGNIEWDMEMARRNIPVYMFDNSIERVPLMHPQFKFYRSMIGPEKDQVSFDALASRYAERRLEAASAIMKMDIEHWEWATLDAAAPESLRKFRQLAVELHCLDLMASPDWWARAHRVLRKLQEEFFVVHVHANVIGGALLVGGIPFPNVLEVTFASRHYYRYEETDELFPTALDASCDPRLPDLYLGSFKF
jgi:hypothetical protein